jgi:hypothetical protein
MRTSDAPRAAFAHDPTRGPLAPCALPPAFTGLSFAPTQGAPLNCRPRVLSAQMEGFLEWLPSNPNALVYLPPSPKRVGPLAACLSVPPDHAAFFCPDAGRGNNYPPRCARFSGGEEAMFYSLTMPDAQA